MPTSRRSSRDCFFEKCKFPQSFPLMGNREIRNPSHPLAGRKSGRYVQNGSCASGLMRAPCHLVSPCLFVRLTGENSRCASRTNSSDSDPRIHKGNITMLQNRAAHAAAVAILLFCETAAAFMSPGRVLLFGGGGSSRLGGCTRSGATPSRVTKAATSMAAATTSKLGKTLKKPTGALTIGFQVCPAAQMKERDVEELSAVLRKSKASIIFSDAASLPSFTKEQSKAKGNFPGPCPVVAWAASEEDMAASKEAGAVGVVVSVSELGVEKAATLAESAPIDVIFQVKSVSEAEEAVKAGAKVVLVSGAEDLEAVRGAIPQDVAAIASVGSMMPGNAEADTARALKAAG